MTNDMRRSIPLEDRVQEAIILSIGVNALEVTVLKCPWAKTARVHAEHLEVGRELKDYRVDQRCHVFLLQPRSEPEGYYGSLRWARPENNPWRGPVTPRKGDLVEVEAVRFLPNNHALIVQLDSQIEAVLPIREVPVPSPTLMDIREVIDLRDRLLVEISTVRPDTLDVEVSLNAALHVLREKEKAQRIRENGIKPPTYVPAKDWGLKVGGNARVALFVNNANNAPLVAHLTDWLENFGFIVSKITSIAQLDNVLTNSPRPTLLVCLSALWRSIEDSPVKRSAERRVRDHVTRIVWLSAHPDTEQPPLPGTMLPLPIRVEPIVQALLGRKPEPGKEEAPSATAWQFEDFQARHVQNLLDRFLAALCADLRLAGALWIVKELPGRYHVRGAHGIEAAKIEAIEPRLAQTLAATCIEETLTVDWGYGRLGPLREICPEGAERALCYPIPYIPMGRTKPVVERALVAFYSGQENSQLPHRLRPYQEAMAILVHTLHFARHNETLSALASLGRVSASYLHELGEKAAPLKAFFEAHPTAETISDAEWETAREQIGELLDMARDDLSKMRRIHKDRLQLRTRLARMATLYNYRFHKVECKLEVNIPDASTFLWLNPLIVDDAVHNLLDNALHYASLRKEGGRVKVNVYLDPAEGAARGLVIAVSDNGPGVKASRRAQLFRPRHTAKDHGSGMGLHNSQSLIEGIGGTIEFDPTSVRWVRTTFLIRLPIVLGQ